MSVHGLWTGQSYYLADSYTNDAWWLDGQYTAPPNLTLRDATIGSVHTDNWWSGTLSTWGPSTITNGVHVGAFSGFSINLQRVGAIEIDGSSSVGYHTRFEVNGGGPYQQLTLNGTLALNAASTVIHPDVVGNGNIVLVGHGSAELGGAVGSGETIWCLEGGLQIDQPQLLQGTIEGLGDGITLKGLGGVADAKLTATDFTFTSTLYNSDGTAAYTGAMDLHIKDTPYHQVVVRHAGGPDGGSVLLSAQTSPVGALPQSVIHQTA